MIEVIVFLLAALFILAKSSQVVMDNALLLARFFRISEMAAGFVLVSVSTSLPELVVGIIAALEGQEGIVVGNVFGSNIADILLVLGISVAAAGAIYVKKKQVGTLVKILLVTSVLPLVMLLNVYPSFYGIGLLLVFVAYVYYVLKERIPLEAAGEVVSGRKAVFSAFLFLFGVAFVIASSKFAVDYAVQLATLLGVSKAFIGATIIAVGTSLPELSVDLVAVLRKHPELAMGDILGSCITNLTLVLGTSLVIGSGAFNLLAFINLVIFMLVANVVLWYFIRQGKLTRRDAFVLLALYVIFLVSAVSIEQKF